MLERNEHFRRPGEKIDIRKWGLGFLLNEGICELREAEQLLLEATQVDPTNEHAREHLAQVRALLANLSHQ